jgi:hypothetical protein
MGKIESACFEYLNTKILVGARFFTFFEKFVWLFVHVKITRNIRQPPTTLEKSSNIFLGFCLPIPCVSLGFCFKIPQIL